ncbi:MAG: hypothetical protein L0H29_10345 [Sinobacteraceae bacterium]|nr:hypothetical protein [Nevskiaceae bacterium]
MSRGKGVKNKYGTWLKLLAVAVLGVGFLISTTAQAQEDGTEHGVPIWKHSLKWWEKHTYWRLGAAEYVYAGSSTDEFLVSDSTSSGKVSLGRRPGRIAGSGSGTSSHETLAMGVLGFIWPIFGGHFSTEVLLAAPLKLDFEARGTVATEPVASYALKDQSGDPMPTDVGAIGRKIGTLHALPPNFTIVYRPFLHSIIRPYIGVGAFWMYTYSMDISSPTLHNEHVKDPTLTLSRPVGCVGQAGFDVKLPWGFYLTADARFLGCATVHAELRNIEVWSPSQSPSLGVIHVGTFSVDNHLRAWLFSVSLGASFWGG